MKFALPIRFLSLCATAFIATDASAKQNNAEEKLVLKCEAKSSSYSYTDNISYIKDNPSNSHELYSETFTFVFPSSHSATKKHDTDMIQDEVFSATKTASIYKLKSVKSTDDVSIIIDLSTGKFSSVQEKHDALLRIKSNGNCKNVSSTQ